MVDKGERSPEREKYLEEFGERYKNGLEEFLESIEIIGSGTPNPGSLDMGDDRDFEELEGDELEKMKDILYKALGIESDSEVRKYESEADAKAQVPGKIEVRVLATNIEDIVLQEMTFTDGAVRWMIGPDQNI